MSMVPTTKMPTKKYWVIVEASYLQSGFAQHGFGPKEEQSPFTYEFDSQEELTAFEEGLILASWSHRSRIIRRWNS